MKYIKHIILSLFVFICSCKPVQKSPEIKSPWDLAISMCFLPSGVKWVNVEGGAPLLEGMETLNIPVTTDHDLARRYFNQGLLLSYSFNHAEAARSFQYAYQLDPGFAMAFWGYAYVLGPNYNDGMDDDHYALAFNAVKQAMARKSSTTLKEQRLIEALDARYTSQPVSNRYDLDMAYSKNMESVYHDFPDDPDIATLYAESLMDLQPWDLWDKSGNPIGNAELIVDILEKVIVSHPYHPGANHLYIHAVEGSSAPERGLASAKLLGDGLVPLAGHLVHMASHIYIQTGDYNEGTLVNLKAAKVDSMYIKECEAQGVYPIAYFPHNYHFMAGTAILEGNSHWAIYAADKLYDHVEKDLMGEEGLEVLHLFHTIPWFVRVKFGKWDDILNRQIENTEYPFIQGVQHFARGMAFLGKQDVQNAEMEWRKLLEYTQDPSLENALIWGINSLQSVLQIAERVLYGEWKASLGNTKEALMALKEANDIEENLLFNEPPDWFLSVRHNLGAVLLEAGENQEAIEVFQKDLKIYPRNGWALHGLKLAYNNNGNTKALEEIDQQISEVWTTSDISLATSRIK